MPEVVVDQRFTVDGRTVGVAKAFSGDSHTTLNVAVADSETDFEIVVSIDISEVKAFIVTSDQDVLLETNSGSVPDDTLNLKANVPYLWTSDNYDTFRLGTDVTAIFITNSSGSTATIRLETLEDPTP